MTLGRPAPRVETKRGLAGHSPHVRGTRPGATGENTSGKEKATVTEDHGFPEHRQDHRKRARLGQEP